MSHQSLDGVEGEGIADRIVSPGIKGLHGDPELPHRGRGQDLHRRSHQRPAIDDDGPGNRAPVGDQDLAAQGRVGKPRSATKFRSAHGCRYRDDGYLWVGKGWNRNGVRRLEAYLMVPDIAALRQKGSDALARVVGTSTPDTNQGVGRNCLACAIAS